jgi:uroporphyrinogen decarboxylase
MNMDKPRENMAPQAVDPAGGMNSRQRFQALMNYEPVDRGVWTMPWLGFPETLERWQREGFRNGDLKQYPVDDWTWRGDLFFPHPPFARQVLEEDERHVLYINHEGILMREFRDNPMGSMPQFVRFPVQTREDFRKFARERLQPSMAARLGADWAAQLKAERRQETVYWMIADRWGGFFGPLRNLLGVEELCMRFYTEPALVEEMMETIADFVIAQAGQILDQIEVDAFGLWEDMGFNKGPLINPELVRRHMLPHYKRVTEYLRRRGVKWIVLDSDGQIESLIPIWLEAGINILYPFEVAAGMDVVACRRKFGKDLRMLMGVDKRPLAQGRAAIDREIERVRPLIEEGGYVPNTDHSVPPDVSWSNFQYYMERLARVLGIS